MTSNAALARLVEAASKIAFGERDRLPPELRGMFDRAVDECHEVKLEVAMWPSPEVRLFAADPAGEATLLRTLRPRQN
jgi:hypothetical protein